MSELRPRLFFVNRVYWPSTEATAQLLSDLATGLAGRGWDVHIIAAGAPTDVPDGIHVHRTGPGDKNSGLVSRIFNYTRFLAGARRQLRRLVRSGDVVVIMTDPPLLGALTESAARGQGAHVVHWAQDIYPEILTTHLGQWSKPLLAPLLALRNRTWRVADRCVTLGTDMAGVLTANGVPPDRLHVIPNWAPRELKPESDIAAIKAQRLAWKLNDRMIVAYSGNLGRVHEFATIIEAAELLRNDPTIAFVFIGAGAQFAKVHRAVSKHRLTNVHFFPAAPRPQLGVSLGAADIQLVTVNPEFATLVFPSKLAGVLAVGRPVLFIGPPTGEIAQLVRTYDCGRTFARGHASEIAATLRAWQDDPAQSSKRGHNAHTAFFERFTFEASLSAWEDLLSNFGPSQDVPLR